MKEPISIEIINSGLEYVDSQLAEASAADAEMFRQSVFNDNEKESLADKIIEKFSSYSEDLTTKREHYEESLARASETGNPHDVVLATKAMGDYQLQVLLATKVASKSSSTVDKLTNLQ